MASEVIFGWQQTTTNMAACARRIGQGGFLRGAVAMEQTSRRVPRCVAALRARAPLVLRAYTHAACATCLLPRLAFLPLTLPGARLTSTGGYRQNSM